MTIKTTLLAISILGSAAFQDSPPLLHKLKGRDIASLMPSDNEQTLTVVLKNGNYYTYATKDYDFEDHYPSVDKKVAAAVRGLERRFTQTEQPSVFPGGEEAWDKYIQAFCLRHKREIKDNGAAEITVQFVVHLKGQVVDINILSNPDHSALTGLAIQAINDGPAWVPAVQNGRAVVSYCRQIVKLSL